MYKVFIWGTGYWGEKCFCDILPDVVIVGFVESRVKNEYFHGKKVIAGSELAGYEYDYVILANTYEDEIVKEWNLDSHKILFYRQKPELNSVRLFGYQVINEARGLMPYLSVECDGLKFIYNKTDILMPDMMSFYRSTWSKAEMEFFYLEAPRRHKGYFIDIGANIGTTSIYFRKKLALDLKYLAFEPVRENCKILKMNCILNDCEDIIVENLGVSDIERTMGLTVAEVNYGGSRVTDMEKGSEICETAQLDMYVKRNNISPSDISYIWMDIEGHEANAITGAKNLLLDSPASLFMEYNAAEYKANGKLEEILGNLCDIYHWFICYEQYAAGAIRKRKISELKYLAEEMEYKQCNVLFMK